MNTKRKWKKPTQTKYPLHFKKTDRESERERREIARNDVIEI